MPTIISAGIGSGLDVNGIVDQLVLEILGGAFGARGTVSFTRGVADQLDSLLDVYLGSDSPIDSRTDELNTSINEIDNQRELLEQRMIALEERYRTQFNALDILLSQLQITSNFLTQQLESLPGAYQPGS